MSTKWKTTGITIRHAPKAIIEQRAGIGTTAGTTYTKAIQCIYLQVRMKRNRDSDVHSAVRHTRIISMP